MFTYLQYLQYSELILSKMDFVSCFNTARVDYILNFVVKKTHLIKQCSCDIERVKNSCLCQDISHVLADIFKDLYTAEVIGKDTVANLTKSRRGGNSYHDRYVEQLQQVSSKIIISTFPEIQMQQLGPIF